MYRVHLLTLKATCSFLSFGSRESFPRQGLLLFSPLCKQMALPVRSQHVALPLIACAGAQVGCDGVTPVKDNWGSLRGV